MLISFYLQHPQFTKEDMLALAQKTGLTLSVVRKWLWDRQMKKNKKPTIQKPVEQLFKVQRDPAAVKRMNDEIGLEPY